MDLARLGWALAFLAQPALAQDVKPPQLADYGSLPAVELMALSDDGKGIATVARIHGERELLVANHTEPRRISVGDTKVWGLEWAGNDYVLLSSSATTNLGPFFTASKIELQTTIVLKPADGKPAAVFGGRHDMSQAVFGRYGVRKIGEGWQAVFGGLQYRLTADRTEYVFDHGRPTLFTVDLATNSARKLADPAAAGQWRDWLVDDAGKVAATLDFVTTSGKWTIRNAQGKPVATGADPTGDVDLVSLGRAGDSVLYSIEDDKAGEVRWYEVPLAGGAATEFGRDAGIERIYRDRLNGRLLGYLQQDSGNRPIMFNPAHQLALTKVYRAFPNLDVEIRDWTPDFSHVLVRTSGTGDSGTWYLVDIAGRKADPVGTERPRIAPEQVGPVSRFEYRAADGLEMDGVLTLPPGRAAKGLPIVVLPHGGPTAHDVVAFDWWAQAYASRGYAVLQPNFRGSTGRSDSFRRAGNGQWGRKMQSDISDGVAALAKEGIVDPRRACIVGASYGGYAALAGVTLQQGLYRCAVAVAPVSDLSDLYRTDLSESGHNHTVRRSLRESWGDPSTFNEVSPRRNAARADAPILLIHGRNDTVVPYRHSSAMADALKDAGKPYELVDLREEDHWLSRSATRQQMLEAAVAFVERHNPAK